MRALVSNSKGKPLQLVTDRFKPIVADPKDVVIKNFAAALNPVDNFMMASGVFVDAYPHVFGCDCAGIVEALGVDAKAQGHLDIGDRVAAYTGLGLKDSGTLAEYSKVPYGIVFKIPNSMSFEAASTLGVGYLTASLMYFKVSRGREQPASCPVLVYGGSSSVGQYAIQIAKNEGRRVLAVVSSKHFDLMKALGADECYDYRDASWKEKVCASISATGKPIVLDTISSEETASACAQVAKSCGSSEVVVTQPGLQGSKHGMKITSVLLAVVPKDPAITAEVIEYVKTCNRWLKEGKIKPNAAKVYGGLETAIQALEDLSSGKASGEKFVVRPQS